MQINKGAILSEAEKYYSAKLEQYGVTPNGVDWNSKESQVLRFEQLCKIINTMGPFSINDLGCGYGALYDFIFEKHEQCSYFGIDISPSMIQAAKSRFQSSKRVSFIVSDKPEQVADYGMASGIFNVRSATSDSDWYIYIEDTLSTLNSTSRLGFSFNCLTLYSDKDKMADHLFYADPGKLFDLCKRRFSNNVALLHDYGLFEFTILVRKMA